MNLQERLNKDKNKLIEDDRKKSGLGRIDLTELSEDYVDEYLNKPKKKEPPKDESSQVITSNEELASFGETTDSTDPIGEKTKTSIKTSTPTEDDDKGKIEAKDIFKALPKSREAGILRNQLNKTEAILNKLENPSIDPAEIRRDMYNDLKGVRDDRSSMLQWAKLAERTLAAATKWYAAKEGDRQGLDMSKAEIERTNWDALIENTWKTYKSDLAELSDVYDKQDKAKADVDSKRTELKKHADELASRVGRAEDARARTIATLRQKHKDRLQDIKLKREKNKLTKDIAEAKAAQKQSPDSTESDRARATLDLLIENGDTEAVDAFITKNWDHLSEEDTRMLKKSGWWNEEYAALPPKSAPTEPKPNNGEPKTKIIIYEGKKYRVGPDGDLTEI
jgi:hypothetical protein